MPEGVPRRRLLGWIGAAGGVGVAAGTLGDRVVPDARNAKPSSSRSAGPADSTVATAPGGLPQGLRGPIPAFGHVLAIDLAVDGTRAHRASRAAAGDLLRAWTSLARRAGRGAEQRSAEDDRADAGSDIGPASLEVTPGVGASLLRKCGLEDDRPDALVDLPSFRTDRLQDHLCGGDLVVQLAAEDPMRLAGAVQTVVSGLGDIARVRWSRPGFRQTAAAVAHPGQTGRNLMGHKDGTNNPEHGTPLWDSVVRARHRSGPGLWMDGGSYLVVRQIRIDLDRWFGEPAHHRDRVIGRHVDSGAALGSAHEDDPVKLGLRASDGSLIVPEHAHIRLASSTRTAGSRIVRRAWNFDGGWLADGTRDAGLLFLAWQADPRRGFVPIQESLVSHADSLNEYTTHVGSAVFAVPAQPPADAYAGQDLLEG